jgi:hypothetical protein
MTHPEHQHAQLTGQPLATSPRCDSSLSQQADDLGRRAVQFVVDCPICGRPVPSPGRASDGSATMAECDRCDVYFTFDPEEVYTPPQDLDSNLR